MSRLFDSKIHKIKELDDMSATHQAVAALGAVDPQLCGIISQVRAITEAGDNLNNHLINKGLQSDRCGETPEIN